MPKFSQESFSHLTTCHPDLQAIFFEVIKNMDCTIIQGFRNQTEQEADFAAGKTKLQWPHGKHNASPSMAVDVAPYPVDFSNANQSIMRYYFFAGYVVRTAEELRLQGKVQHGIRWGGNWSGDLHLPIQKFNDLVHFELV